MAGGRARRWWIVAGVGLALVVVVGSGVIFAFRDTATPSDEADVVAGMGTLVVGTEPGDPGLYVYATTGYETTDALGGGRHEYPAETYLTLQPGGCGSIVRWHALKERTMEWEYCEGIPLPVRWIDYHRWFGVVEEGVFGCARRPDSMPGVGESWSTACSSNDTTKDDVWEVFGREDVAVGGELLPTVHVRRSSQSSGKTVGPLVVDTWYLEGTVLPVRRELLSDTVTSSPIGAVHYHEEYTIELITPFPRS
jgi:hypothetical protein